MMKRGIITLCSAVALGAATLPAHAYQEGDWVVRAGVAHLSPNDSSDEILGGEVGVDSTTGIGFNVTYMVTDRIGVQVLGALPFKHDLTHDVAGDIGETKHLPPTVTVQYHFQPMGQIRPYVGAGLNYTHFFDEEVDIENVADDLSLDNSFSWAVEAGIDYALDEHWLINAALWYIDLDTTAELEPAGAEVDVTIDPWVALVGGGYRF